MELNFLIFPSPKPSYTNSEANIIQIPRAKGPQSERPETIPCLFLPSYKYNYETNEEESFSNVLLYFHGNAEDVGLAREFVQDIKDEFNVRYLLVQRAGRRVPGLRHLRLEEEQRGADRGGQPRGLRLRGQVAAGAGAQHRRVRQVHRQRPRRVPGGQEAAGRLFVLQR